MLWAGLDWAAAATAPMGGWAVVLLLLLSLSVGAVLEHM